MKVFYMPQQTAEKNNSYSPSAGKPALAVLSWVKLGLKPEDIVPFEPVTRDQLKKVHASNYVDGVLDLRTVNGFGNTFPEIATALPFVAGSAVNATLHALKTGETAFSPTSGAHHACYNMGGGFCTFNFLVLAAVEAYEAGAKKVGIFDCDMHYGNGTVDIIHGLGLHFIRHYTFGGGGGRTAEQWISDLPAFAAKFMEGLDVLIYNAGADPHIEDPLGGVLTTEQLAQRDYIVLDAAKRAGVPVMISLAGGYQEDIRKVLDVHDNTYRAVRLLELEV